MGHWLVTGASRGLGRRLVQGLVDRGHQVVAIARNVEGLSGERITPLALDLSDAAAVVPAVQAAVDALPVLDGVINNAGTGWYKPFAEHSESELVQIVQVNLIAAMQVCHAVLPRLLAQGRGHIVNIGSDLARRPLANMAAYVASKHGLAGFSHSLLREVKGAGIKVTLVNPGIIDTGFGGAVEGSREEAWSLRPAALAALVLQAIETPGSMLVDELTVHPLGQDF